MGRYINNLTGKVYGELTVLCYVDTDKGGNARWRCRCSCGKETVTRANLLRQGKTLSCGHKRRLKGSGTLAENAVISNYRAGAKTRGYVFELTDHEILSLMRQPCAYCGKTGTNRKRGISGCPDFVYNGIDRVDNSRGYEPGNVVPCCKFCNKMKHNLSVSEFLAHVARIEKFQRSI